MLENLTRDKIPQCWLLLIYRVPQEPPGRRTYVWRQLKSLGAIYLQQAAAILPDRAEVRTALEELNGRIRGFQGEASLLKTISPDLHWEENLIQRFNQARNAEYAELVDNVERFEDEIRRESSKGRLSFAQLEDIEADWEKLQRWQERISARDFFQAPGRSGATKALEQGQAALEAFTAQVYALEGVNEEGPNSQCAESNG
jgi:hypothetical protein